MAPFAWQLLWRGLSVRESLEAERRLLDLGGGRRWRGTETLVAEADVVHSVSLEGEGAKVLVLLHGLGTGGGIFFRNLDRLSECGAFSAVHAVDWRGAGLSGRPAYAATSHDEARDFLVDGLEAWRRGSGVETMVLLGHSMGGLVAAHYAARHGKRVEHLVLCGPASVERRPRAYEAGESRLYDAAVGLWEAGYHPAALVRSLGPFGKRLVEKYARRRFNSGIPLSEAEAEALGEYLYGVNGLPGSSERCMNQLLAPIAQPRVPIAPIVEALDMPVTYVYGETDWMNPTYGSASAERLRDRGKDAACSVIPGGGHYIFLEQPAAFQEALLARVAPPH